MEITLTLACEELSDERIQKTTVKMADDLKRETGVDVKLPEKKGGPGEKGWETLLGQILVPALSGGGAVASMVAVWKLYVQKHRTLKMKVKCPNGAELNVQAENLTKDQYDRTLAEVSAFLEGCK